MTTANAAPLALVVMPFKPEFDDFYQDVILPTLESLNFRVTRAQSLVKGQDVLKDNVIAVNRASLIIVDLTLPSASVLYPLGLAHGMLKSTILITRRMDSVPFDLRSYRLIEYSTHYKKVEDFKEKLRDLIERHREGIVEYNNPVMDYVPGFAHPLETKALISELERSLGLEGSADETFVARPPVNAADTANGKRPRIYEFAVEAVQAMEKINNGVRRLTESTTTFERMLVERTDQVKQLRTKGVKTSPAELREVLEDVAVRVTEYADRAPTEIPTLRAAWERLLKNTADLIASARIETPQDREAAKLFVLQLQTMQKTVLGSTAAVQAARDAINHAPNLNKNLNGALKKAETSLNQMTGELATEQAYLHRLLNLLQERLNATSKSPEGA
jgi:hypothetical protein